MDEIAIQSTSNVNPFALLFLIVAGYFIARSSRENAVRALLLEALLIPLGQQFVLFGLHFRFFRILILIGFWRALSRGEARAFYLTKVDKLFLGSVLACVICGVLRGPKAETFGIAYDALGGYFLIRILAQNTLGVVAHIRMLGIVAVIMAVAMAWEASTRHNLFHVFGGVPELTYIREGRFRCQGPFRHPILAGTFAASLFPLMMGLWFQGGRDRWKAVPGIFSCVFCTYVAASSGALMTLIAGVLGIGLWRMRNRMVWLRRGAVIAILGLMLIMNAPVWYLISRLSDLTGGTGWHRSYLIEASITHLHEWWLIGSSYTAHWAADPYTILPNDPDNMDITNNYIEQGLQGGVLGLLMFLGYIIASFNVVGRFVQAEQNTVPSRRLAWSLGVALFANCVAFISVSYFDQILVAWFWLIAVIALHHRVLMESETATSQTDETQTGKSMHEAEAFAAGFTSHSTGYPENA